MSISSKAELAAIVQRMQAAAAACPDEVEPKPITEQRWMLGLRDDGIYLIGEDGSAVLKLCRPDHGSDLVTAGYVVGLQANQLKRFTRDNENTAEVQTDLTVETCRISHHQRKYGCSIPDCPRYTPREEEKP